ncbi:MAG: serine/threonine protein kinase [Myxococcales bacterium]|nr:serine/threonine protein kinase [Myxococcales bacterium]
MTDEAKPVDPRIGAVVAGKFEILDLIGQGGLGRVYRARDTGLDELVAVKFLRAEIGSIPELRARFRREAVALARVRHPGIVSLLDYGQHEEEPFLAMELVHGVCLADVIGDGNTLPRPRVPVVFDQLLQVLEAAHALGVVHRDIKPDNVMLVDAPDRSDRIKVLDFGLAHLDRPVDQEKLTQTGMAQGTAAYMAPEQCRGEKVGPKADVYAVGTMLFEALSGDTPFHGDAASLMAQQMFVAPPPLEERAPDLPAGVPVLVAKALAKEADERPTASEMRDALRAAFGGTDEPALAARAAELRERSAGLTRSERGLTGVRGEDAVASERAPAHLGDVRVRGSDAERASSLGTALAMLGVTNRAKGTAVTTDDARDADLAMLVAQADDATRRALTGRARDARPMVFVADIGDVAEVREWIRLGAVDVALAGAEDADTARRIKRLLERRRIS